MNNYPQSDHQKKVNNDNIPKAKNHWEKYKLYYLVGGSFFFTTLIVLISNSRTNDELKKLKSQPAPINWQRPDHEYSSDFIKPDPARKNENWVQEHIVKDSVRKEVETWINSFKYLPKYFAQEGPEIDKHVLISGPPGTGKTYLALDFCHNESLQYSFVKFDTVILKGSSIAKQKKALAQARAILQAEGSLENKPIVMVIDELDSIGIKDTSAINSASRDEVNGLLTMFDDINRERLNIIVIGITNYPEALDPALVRSGRFGRKIEVGYPTDEETDKLLDFLESEMKGKRGYKFVGNQDKWSNERSEGNLIIKWPSDFWSEVRRITKAVRVKYSQEIKGKIEGTVYKIKASGINTGFTLRDLEKFIGTCLAVKSGKDIREIIPTSQDYEVELEKEMQRRIKNMIAAEARRPRPTPPARDEEEEQQT